MAEENQNDSVSRTMSAVEIIAILGRHGCPDITRDIDVSQCSSGPAAGGGFGDIYRGSLYSGIQVAIKCPRLYLDDNQKNRDVLKMAAREIYTWSKCKHDNVLELTGLAYFLNHIAMVSPWMENGTLPQYLIRNPDSDRCSICTQIASGLAYLHAIDIVHGDVKGANVLISGDGIAKLTDFGNTTLKTHTLHFTGTNSASSFSLRWTAPEVLDEITGHTRQADVYALGMTILETISGEVPFRGKSDAVVFVDVVVKRRLPIRPETTIPTASRNGDSLWQLLTLCWVYEPSARPEMFQVLKQLRDIKKEGLSELVVPVDYEHLADRRTFSETLNQSTSFDCGFQGIEAQRPSDPENNTLVGGHTSANPSSSLYGTPATHFSASTSYASPSFYGTPATHFSASASYGHTSVSASPSFYGTPATHFSASSSHTVGFDASKSNQDHQSANRQLPISLSSLVPLHIGIETSGGLFCEVFRRYSIPGQQNRVFTTVGNSRIPIKIRLFDGINKLVENNRFLGEFELSDVAPGSRISVMIDWSMADSSIMVTARNESSDEVQTFRVPKHLEPGSKVIDRALKEREQRAQARNKNEQLSNLFKYVKLAKLNLGDTNDILDPKPPGDRIEKLSRIEEWAIRSRSNVKLDELDEKLGQARSLAEGDMVGLPVPVDESAGYYLL